MDKDRVEGAKKRTRGSLKEAIGKITGNTRAQVEGRAEAVAGWAQGARSEAWDASKK
ncbi:CsbD family protein [Methylobacterium goesingense]|nr:CsbD family protein [Methylobacterium goesingense]GJD75792.1 hypothetical protein CFIICLFH_4037 [Methylobacterium goesingense]